MVVTRKNRTSPQSQSTPQSDPSSLSITNNDKAGRVGGDGNDTAASRQPRRKKPKKNNAPLRQKGGSQFIDNDKYNSDENNCNSSSPLRLSLRSSASQKNASAPLRNNHGA